MDEFDFVFPGDEHSRKAYRTPVPGLETRVHFLNKFLKISDLSALGMGLVDNDLKRLEVGFLFECDLFLNKKLYIAGLQAKIIRIRDEFVGCQFEAMNARQEARLDKLVLEVQKRLIALQRARRQKEQP